MFPMYREQLPGREISKSLNTSDQQTMVFVDVSKGETTNMTLDQWIQVIMLLCMVLQTLRVFGIM